MTLAGTDHDIIQPDLNRRHWDALAATRQLASIDTLANPFANTLAKLLGTLIQRHGRGGDCQQCRWQPVPLQPLRVCDDLVSAWKSAEMAQQWMNNGYPKPATATPPTGDGSRGLGEFNVVHAQRNLAVSRSFRSGSRHV